MVKITPSTYSVGVLNPQLRVFDVIMPTDFGTSYNAFLVKGEKTVLIDTCHASFFEPYLENIKAICDPAEVDYIICNHTEPDHAGVLARLLDHCPKAEVYCSQAASRFLRAITNRQDFPLHVVKDKETLDIGGLTLEFIIAPFLHWPDSMFTYLPEEKVLFTCDFLGTHYCEPRMWDKHVTYPKAYDRSFREYYDAIFSPFPTHVQYGLAKIREIDVDVVCTSHGPLLRKEGLLGQAMDKYAAWSLPRERSGKHIPIFFVSAYGNTAKAAYLMREEILRALPDASVPLYDIIEHDMHELTRELNQSDAFLIGTPTINREALPPVWNLLAHVDAINCAKKPCGVFGSFGWSGEGVPNVCQRLTSMKMKVAGSGLRFNFVPSAEEQDACRAYAKEFIALLD